MLKKDVSTPWKNTENLKFSEISFVSKKIIIQCFNKILNIRYIFFIVMFSDKR